MKILERARPAGALTMPLGVVRLRDLPRVGGKAAQLGELIAAGLPVPSGFVVTTAACQQFLQSDPRIAEWLEILEKSDPQDTDARRAASGEARQGLNSLKVPRAVAEAIVAALAGEPDCARAVRSSATVEDLPEASFAGQHDSFLNVCGGDAIVAAVKRCWLSLFSERAISYRRRKGIAPGRAQMAVIVQQLVDAEASGVMFTTNPAAGAADAILIEAAFGLGEIVVQGRVAPDRLEIARKGLRVVRRETGLKGVRIVAAADGVCEQALTAEKAGAPVLTDALAVRVAGLGLEAERLLGRPLDLEWCVRGGEVWLLQARPVTTVPARQESSFADRQVWTNANAGEVLPDVVTPLTWSILKPQVCGVLQRGLRFSGVKVRADTLLGLIAGRAYFNFNTLYALGRHLPGWKSRGLETLFGGQQDTMLALQEIQLADGDLPRVEVNCWRAAAGAPVAVASFLGYSTQYCQTVMTAVRRANDDRARLDPERLANDELVTTIRALATVAELQDLRVLGAFSFGLAYTAILFDLGERWFGPEGRETANRLLAGVGDLEHAAAGHDLWRLAESAARDAEIKDFFFGERTFAALVTQLDGCPGGRAFLERWNEFMRRHGHHARGEIELYNPRWSECPDFVLDLVRGYVAAINAGHPSPVVRLDALAGERKALTHRCLAGLKNPLKRAVFRMVLDRAQKGGRFRENLKSEWMRQFAVLRRLLLELGRRLAAGGRLADQSDVFFLEIEELAGGSVWNSATDWRALVASRRSLYNNNLKLTPPAVVIGRFDPECFVPAAVDYGRTVFHGLGVSAGKASGRARVILRSDAHERLLPGEILVAPFTDPGWTPYFVAAAGIVMDLGGLLSHGSIVAREYGIPAVVNVGPATQIIRTGQWLEVDADQGVVTVVEKTE